MWLDVYEYFGELAESEQLASFNAMKQDLFPGDPSKITKLLKDIREARFASGMVNSPNCLYTSNHIVERFQTALYQHYLMWS